MEPSFFGLFNPRQKTMAKMMIKEGNLSRLSDIIDDEDYKRQVTSWIANLSKSSMEENEFELIDSSDSLQNIYLQPDRRGEPTQGLTSQSMSDASLPMSSFTMMDDYKSIEDAEHIYASIDSPQDGTLSLEPHSDCEPIRFNNIPTELFKKLKNETTIVLLSESGTGKSTYVNGFLNYLRYSSMDEAIANGVELLIPTSFTHVNEEKALSYVECPYTIQPRNCPEGWLENEDNTCGNSATQPYVIHVGPPGEEKIIQLIDTPGIADTGGIKKEEQNIRNILDLLTHYSKIDAICILLKSNDSRLNIHFRYCLSELLSHLHMSAAANILFCFTQVRGTQYKPGESLTTLIKFLEQLQKDRDIRLELKNSTFCFDNDCIRFLCEQKNGINHDEKEKSCYKESWDFSSEETIKLLTRVAEMKPHNVDDTLSINNTRLIVLALVRPLAEITKIQATNTKLIDEKITEIEKLIKEERTLRGKLYVRQAKLVAKNLPYPVTVCIGKGCVDYKRLGNEPDAPMETIYKTICHDKCYLNGVETSVVPNPALQSCYAFQANIDKCRHCKCPWTTHMHIRYKLDTVFEKTKDVLVEENMANYKEQAQQGQQFLDNLRSKKSFMEMESKFITECCVKFAAFINAKSILPFNDAYNDYLEHLITEEKNKIYMDIGVSRDTLEHLQKRKREYDQQKNAKESANKEPPLSPAEIKELVDQLKDQASTGELLKEIQNMELLSVKKEKTNFGRLVKRETSHFTTFQPTNYE